MMRRLSPILAIFFMMPLAWAQQPVSLALQPTIVQKAAAVSSSSLPSLAANFANQNQRGDSIVVVFANGNSNNAASPISDTNSNTYTKAVQVANGSAFEVEIWYATNIAGGTNSVTVTPGGTNASIAIEIYEVSGLIAVSPQVLDQTNSGTATGTSLSTGAVVPLVPNEFAFVAFGVGTAAQTITVASPYTNDSGQENPTSAAGLFSFVSASSYLANTNSTTATATITSEPWAAAIATFRPVAVPIQGAVVASQPTGTNLHVVNDANATVIIGETVPVATATTTDTALRCVLVSAASTNSTNCKGSAGNVYGYRFVNTTATLYYLRMYNSTNPPTCSSAAGFVESIPIPASASGAGIVAIEPMGEGYSTGISFCFTGGSSSTDNTNAATGVFGTILYK